MSTPPPQLPTIVLDLWMTSVTVIQIMSTGKAPNPCNVGSATGFFYKKGEDKYLITNRHVVVQERKGFYPDSFKLRIHTNRSDLTQNRDVTIYDTDGTPFWLEHPLRTNQNEIDIIAININSYLEAQDFISCWSVRNFKSPEEIISLGDLVLVMGYPMKFYDSINNLPIPKSGTLASPYLVGFQNKPIFLIDANLQKGMSGSPVVLPERTSRRTRTALMNVGRFPALLLGIYSAEVFKGISLGLHVVWYPNLIQEIVSQ